MTIERTSPTRTMATPVQQKTLPQKWWKRRNNKRCWCVGCGLTLLCLAALAQLWQAWWVVRYFSYNDKDDEHQHGTAIIMEKEGRTTDVIMNVTSTTVSIAATMDLKDNVAASKTPIHTAAAAAATKATTATTVAPPNKVPPVVKHKQAFRVKPLQSVPPKPIAMQVALETAAGRTNHSISMNNNNNNNSIQGARHSCIAHIRQEQRRLLGKYATTVATTTTSTSSTTSIATAKAILLMDPAYHRNVGDHMLTLGELEFMKRLGYVQHYNDDNQRTREQQQLQCHCRKGMVTHVPSCDELFAKHPALATTTTTTTTTNNNNNTVDNNNNDTTTPIVAWWQAGGNWGDLYRKAMEPRFEWFPRVVLNNNNNNNNPIMKLVSMPQSLHYQNQTQQRIDTARLQRIIIAGYHNNSNSNNNTASTTAWENINSRFLFSWREKESYQEAMRLYPFAKNLLVPDIAFQLGPYAPMRAPPNKEDPTQSYDIVLFLRRDKESMTKGKRSPEALTKVLSTIPGGNALRFITVDWDDRLKIFNTTDPLFTDSAIQLLSLGKVVICDRLHASILSYLTGLPFVYMNQVTRKVNRTLSAAFDSWEGCWDRETAMWDEAENLRDAFVKAIRMLHLLNSTREDNI